MDTAKLLKTLTSASGVSGAEEDIRETLFEILKEYGEVTSDSLGNVYCTFGEGYHFLLDSHCDEIGFTVKAITDGGFLKLASVGGIDKRLLLASEVTVHGKEEICGVISTLPPHLLKESDKKVPDLDDVAVDIGMTKDEAERLISLGDRVSFRRNFNELLGTRISSSVLDDRSGAAAIIIALSELKDVNAKITAVFSVQEETGLTGARVAPYGKKVDEAIAVDVSFGYTPFCNKKDCGEVGKGPMVGFSPILNKEMSSALCDLAEKNNIPYQREIMGGGSTGTNADVISISESGIKTALVSIPEKYMHSPIEIVDTRDVENTGHLIAHYIKRKAGEVNA